MAFKNCKKVIENNIRKMNSGEITSEEYQVFKSDMTNKLDVFLLNNRITKEQYEELLKLM